MAEWKFIGARRYECSVCGEGIAEMPCDWASGEPLYNFCPYCGANMNMKKADRKTEPQYDIDKGTIKCDNCSESGSYKCSKCDGEMYFKRLEIEDEPQLTPNYCGTCKHREVPCGDLPCDMCKSYSAYEPKTESQTEDKCKGCIYENDQSLMACVSCQGKVPYDGYDFMDEPQKMCDAYCNEDCIECAKETELWKAEQTDCSWK